MKYLDIHFLNALKRDDIFELAYNDLLVEASKDKDAVAHINKAYADRPDAEKS